MGIYTTKPIKELILSEFKELCNDKTITVSPHALDHLSKNQRKVFKEDELIRMVEKESARKIYLQENRRYAAYYRRKDGYRKVIIDMEEGKLIIVSFVDTIEIPRIKL